MDGSTFPSSKLWDDLSTDQADFLLGPSKPRKINSCSKAPKPITQKPSGFDNLLNELLATGQTIDTVTRKPAAKLPPTPRMPAQKLSARAPWDPDDLDTRYFASLKPYKPLRDYPRVPVQNAAVAPAVREQASAQPFRFSIVAPLNPKAHLPRNAFAFSKMPASAPVWEGVTAPLSELVISPKVSLPMPTQNKAPASRASVTESWVAKAFPAPPETARTAKPTSDKRKAAILEKSPLRRVGSGHTASLSGAMGGLFRRVQQAAKSILTMFESFKLETAKAKAEQAVLAAAMMASLGVGAAIMVVGSPDVASPVTVTSQPVAPSSVAPAATAASQPDQSEPVSLASAFLPVQTRQQVNSLAQPPSAHVDATVAPDKNHNRQLKQRARPRPSERLAGQAGAATVYAAIPVDMPPISKEFSASISETVAHLENLPRQAAPSLLARLTE